MKQIYIISDVHGCYKTLLKLIDQFPDKQNSKIVFVGDLIDRGANSYEVIKFVIDNNYDCVLGNHENMLLEYGPNIDSDNLIRDKFWLYNCGGNETLKSYTNKEEFSKHYEFLKTLPLYREYKEYKNKDNRYLVVSHSAVGKVWSKKDSQNRFDIEDFRTHLLYSRYKEFDNKDIFNVFGHTIYKEPNLKAYRGAIDLGCYVKDRNILPNPRLCALQFPSMKIYTQKRAEDEETT